MSLSDDSFPSSKAFDLISDALKNDDKLRQDAVKSAKSIYGFTIKNDSGKTSSWFIDLKDDGIVGKGLAPEGKKADATLILSDKDFQSLASGKAKPQSLFLSGKLKIKGNVMATNKLEPVLKKAQAPKAKL